MEKEEIDIEVNYDLEWLYGAELSQIKKDVEELEKLGVTHVNIDYVTSYDVTYIITNPIIRRLETDEEFNKRKEEQELMKLVQKQKELKILAELKAKYEK